MLAEIGAVLTSGGFGAITGLIGGLTQKWMTIKSQKLDNEHRLNMARVDLAESKLEREHAKDMADANLEQTMTEGDIARDVADAGALSSSIVMAAKDSGVGWVEGVKHMMRPVITILLILQTEWLLYILWGKLGGLEAMDATVLLELFTHIIKQVVFLTVTAVSWWFASRPSRNK